jgi:hypothetical protein
MFVIRYLYSQQVTSNLITDKLLFSVVTTIWRRAHLGNLFQAISFTQRETTAAQN